MRENSLNLTAEVRRSHHQDTIRRSVDRAVGKQARKNCLIHFAQKRLNSVGRGAGGPKILLAQRQKIPLSYTLYHHGSNQGEVRFRTVYHRGKTVSKGLLLGGYDVAMADLDEAAGDTEIWRCPISGVAEIVPSPSPRCNCFRVRGSF